MLVRKNRFMLRSGLAGIIISSLVHVMHSFQQFGRASSPAGGHAPLVYMQLIVMIAPILIWTAACMLYRADAAHPALPLLNSLTLIGSCTSSVMDGGGLAELHFLFIAAIAVIAYYEPIRLALVSALLIVVILTTGLLLDSSWLTDAKLHSARPWLFLAAFLFVTAAAAAMQIRAKSAISKTLTSNDAAALDLAHHFAAAHEVEALKHTNANRDQARHDEVRSLSQSAPDGNQPSAGGSCIPARQPEHQASNLEKAMREFERRSANSGLPPA
ncbi:hypothetical protein ACFFSY_21775 [Paenibacillus aurantiacus]|uniref:Uncharacterized protein n=1 Tax=Paenibacillus aurantiacus TaxID=1936118 RepID=A0ABV5KTL6_9BACL